MKKTLTALAALALTLPLTSAHATVIGIVDSGTDLTHPDLKDKSWNNPGETDDAVDNDDNGYIDDLHGWNFAENNNRLVDLKHYLGKFPPEVYKYFDVQGKYLEGTATADEISWMRQAVKDPAFIQKLETFGNFVHGTHVAGISAKNADHAQIMGLKILPTEAPKPFSHFDAAVDYARTQAGDGSGDAFKLKLLRLALGYISQSQGKSLTAPAKYLKDEGARVANCSFGTSYTAIKGALKPLIDAVLGRAATAAELDDLLQGFMNGALQSMRDGFISQSPNTLFVIAAGNDGSNNDQYPAAPANIKADNTITVAAMLEGTKLASFSNYGLKLVDLAAPGVAIRSTIPGGQYLALSGTSQATPSVTEAAGRIIDANPALTPGQVKQILVGTVDVKDFLRGKVASGGALNADRAVRAAHLSVSHSLTSAISRSRHEVVDIAYEKSVRIEPDFVLPLPSLN